MMSSQKIDFVFFDIGGTLGERSPVTGKLVMYPSSEVLFTAMRDVVNLRMGIITTLGPDLTDTDGLALLQEVGVDDFLDPQGFVSEHTAGAAKPHAAIYQFAAQRVGVPVDRCLYLSENLIEVLGALAAGMQAVLKPCPPGRELPV